MRNVLVIVRADPRTSERGLEALRMSVGLASGENRTKVLLLGEAARLSRPEQEAFPGHVRARKYLDALGEFKAEVATAGDELREARRSRVVIGWNS